MCMSLILKENWYTCKCNCTCCSKYVYSKSTCTSTFKWIMIKTSCRCIYYDKCQAFQFKTVVSSLMYGEPIGLSKSPSDIAVPTTSGEQRYQFSGRLQQYIISVD